MDICIANFKRRFDEEEITNSRDHILADLNHYVWRKCPELRDADTQLSTFPVFDSQETCDMC